LEDPYRESVISYNTRDITGYEARFKILKEKIKPSLSNIVHKILVVDITLMSA